MNLYKSIGMTEDGTAEPVNFVGVHPLRWGKAYHPTCGFAAAEEVELLRAVDALCVESLPPEKMEAWEGVVSALFFTRQELSDDQARHKSDCSLHLEPAFLNNPCDCGAIITVLRQAGEETP